MGKRRARELCVTVLAAALAALAQACGGNLGVAPLPGPDAMATDGTTGDAAAEAAPLIDASAPETASDARADAAASDAGSDATPSGVLDVSFAGTGYVTSTGAAGGPGPYDDRAHAVAIDPGGRVVVAGRSRGGSGYVAATWRFTGAGASDATFGGGGVWLSSVAADASGLEEEAHALVLDGAGAPRVVGFSADVAGLSGTTVWGLTGSGALDATFGASGVRLAPVPAGSTQAVGYGAARDASGRIFAAGSLSGALGADAAATTSSYGMTWCFGSTGAPDTTFASPAGYVLTASTGGVVPSDDHAVAVAVDASGAIVVAGFASEPAGATRVAIWRFARDGTPDATFGASGHVLLPRIVNPGAPSGDDLATSVTTDAQRRVIFAGYGDDAQQAERGFVGRLSASGALDASFGAGGIALIDPPPSTATHSGVSAVALDSLGRVVAAGERSEGNSGYVAVWRLNPAGAFDPTFGNSGPGLFTMTSTAGGQGGLAQDQAGGLAIDAHDRPVIAGQSGSPTALGMAVWRLTS